ncbi:hypothetical protein ACH5RR_003327 [Cinchona calisaya]|uniref:Uncharacterized protein n=1 Tax=Cinchona calisaya TaxID=153742 RepID=A0ABD3AUI7_9GENT
MMEEYDKLGVGDGFTRLRIFLFSHSDQDGSVHFVDGDERDNERRYVDALNSLNESPEYRRNQFTDTQFIGPLDDAHVAVAEQFFNQMSLEGGLQNQRNTEMPMPPINLRQLRIPTLMSGQPQQPVTQRYNEQKRVLFARSQAEYHMSKEARVARPIRPVDQFDEDVFISRGMSNDVTGVISDEIHHQCYRDTPSLITALCRRIMNMMLYLGSSIPQIEAMQQVTMRHLNVDITPFPPIVPPMVLNLKVDRGTKCYFTNVLTGPNATESVKQPGMVQKVFGSNCNLKTSPFNVLIVENWGIAWWSARLDKVPMLWRVELQLRMDTQKHKKLNRVNNLGN